MNRRPSLSVISPLATIAALALLLSQPLATSAQSGSGFTVQMFGEHVGQIRQDGMIVASIIPDATTPGGERLVGARTPQPSAEVLAFFESYKRGGPSPSPQPAATSAPAAARPRVDETPQGLSVTLADGATISFQGENDVTVANLHALSFTVHHKGNSVRGFFGAVGSSAKGKNGGSSLAGGGSEFKDAAGRVLYDTADGTAYRGTMTMAKSVAEAIGQAYQSARQQGRKINSKVIDDLKGAEDHGFPLVTKGLLAD